MTGEKLVMRPFAKLLWSLLLNEVSVIFCLFVFQPVMIAQYQKHTCIISRIISMFHSVFYKE